MGFHEIAGYGTGLQKAIRSAGGSARFVELGQSRFYSVGRSRPWERLYRQSFAWRQGVGRSWRGRVVRFARRICSWLVVADFVLNYDCLAMIGCKEPFGLPLRRIARRFGKTVVTIFLGSDSRPLYLSGYFLDQHRGDYRRLAELVREQASGVRRAERESDYVICHPPCAQFLTRRFVKFLDMGFPFDPARSREIPEVPVAKKSGMITIVHAPSAPRYKGSLIFASMIDRLRDEGFPIEYIELIDRPNGEVLRVLAVCDLVLDELYSDSPMAGLVMEAAFFGKPSIVGSYLSAKQMTLCVSGTVPPSFFVAPENIYRTMKGVCESAACREEMGRKARNFVTREWNPETVGNRLIELLSGRLAEEAFALPGELEYFNGWGISEADLKAGLRNFLATNGAEALCLSRPVERETLMGFLAEGAPPRGETGGAGDGKRTEVAR